MKKIVIMLIVIMVIVFLAVMAKPLLTGDSVKEEAGNYVKLKVDIPCPGHAGLIKYELGKLEGIKEIEFNAPNLFIVRHDNLSLEEITGLEIFREYKAEVIN